MFMESFQDTTIIILIVAAGVSLVVGLYEDPSKGWIEGAAILFAVLLVAFVTATNNYNKEKQFKILNSIKDDTKVSILRDGKIQDLHVKHLIVGDIVVLQTGDKIPADGVLISGSDITCDESALTGESDDKVKSTLPASEGGDIFLLSGSTLSTGYGRMLVTAVGINSRWGRTKAQLITESVETPLQQKLNILADQIGSFGMFSAASTFIVMIAMWFLYPESRKEGTSFIDYLIKTFIIAVTIVVVAVPEGLPLAVTLSLAYSTNKMMDDNNLIRILEACETMGNATNICSDKTGTLTENRMTVVSGWIGGKFFEDLTKTPEYNGNGSLTHATLSYSLSKNIVTFLSHGISVNTTASLLREAGMTTVLGNKTEGSLLLFLSDILDIDYSQVRPSLFHERGGDRTYTFTSARKSMTTLLRNYHAHYPGSNIREGLAFTKGASEIIFGRCIEYLDPAGLFSLFDSSQCCDD